MVFSRIKRFIRGEKQKQKQNQVPLLQSGPLTESSMAIYKVNEEAYLNKLIIDKKKIMDSDISQYSKKCTNLIVVFITNNFLSVRKNIQYLVITPYKLYWLIKLHEVLLARRDAFIEELLRQVVNVLIDTKKTQYIDKALILNFFNNINLSDEKFAKLKDNIVINYVDNYDINLNYIVDPHLYNDNTIYDIKKLPTFIKNTNPSTNCSNLRGYLMNYSPYFKMFLKDNETYTEGIEDTVLLNYVYKQNLNKRFCINNPSRIIGKNTMPKANNIAIRNAQQTNYNTIFGIKPNLNVSHTVIWPGETKKTAGTAGSKLTKSLSSSTNTQKRQQYQQALGKQALGKPTSIKKPQSKTKKSVFFGLFKKTPSRRIQTNKMQLPLLPPTTHAPIQPTTDSQTNQQAYTVQTLLGQPQTPPPKKSWYSGLFKGKPKQTKQTKKNTNTHRIRIKETTL